MVDDKLFENAPELNQRIRYINKTFAQHQFFIDITLMPDHEDVTYEPSLECFQVEQCDKKGKLVRILVNYLTENEVWTWLDGFEVAMEAPLRILSSRFKVLTFSDCLYLVHIGYLTSDLTQIEDAAKKSKYTLNRKRISRKKAEGLLARVDFLSAIGRAAFHASASRKLENGDTVNFEYDFWRK